MRHKPDEIAALLPAAAGDIPHPARRGPAGPHGYAIIQDVEERTGGELRLSPGTLYRIHPAHARAGPHRRDQRAARARPGRRAAALLPDDAVRRGRGASGAAAHRRARPARAQAGPVAGARVMRPYRVAPAALSGLVPPRVRGRDGCRLRAAAAQAPGLPPGSRSGRGNRRRAAQRRRGCTSSCSGRTSSTRAARWRARPASPSRRSWSRRSASAPTTAAFSVTNFVFLRPLPYPSPDRSSPLARTAGYRLELSPPNYRDWKTHDDVVRGDRRVPRRRSQFRRRQRSRSALLAAAVTSEVLPRARRRSPRSGGCSRPRKNAQASGRSWSSATACGSGVRRRRRASLGRTVLLDGTPHVDRRRDAGRRSASRRAEVEHSGR